MQSYDLTYPRGNFNYFLSGFLTIFTVLIGDGWNDIMNDFIRAMNSYVIIFFVSLYIFGNLILLNLFLAILLKNFDEEPEDFNVEKSESGSPVKRLASRISMRMVKILSKLSIRSR